MVINKSTIECHRPFWSEWWKNVTFLFSKHCSIRSTEEDAHQACTYSQLLCQTLLSVKQSSLIISRTQPDDAKIDPCLTYFWLVWTCLFSLLLADHVFLNTRFLYLFPWDSGRIPSGLSELPYHPFQSLLWWSLVVKVLVFYSASFQVWSNFLLYFSAIFCFSKLTGKPNLISLSFDLE